MDFWREPNQMQIVNFQKTRSNFCWLTLYKDIDREGEIVGVSAVTDVIIENHKVPIQIFGKSDLIYTLPEANSEFTPAKMTVGRLFSF